MRLALINHDVVELSQDLARLATSQWEMDGPPTVRAVAGGINLTLHFTDMITPQRVAFAELASLASFFEEERNFWAALVENKLTRWQISRTLRHVSRAEVQRSKNLYLVYRSGTIIDVPDFVSDLLVQVDNTMLDAHKLFHDARFPPELTLELLAKMRVGRETLHSQVQDVHGSGMMDRLELTMPVGRTWALLAQAISTYYHNMREERNRYAHAVLHRDQQTLQAAALAVIEDLNAPVAVLP